jgi:hypothetical protein
MARRMADQVGGHLWSEGKVGMLECDSRILKPIEDDERGERELSFYEDVKDANLWFLPRFYGCRVVEERNHLGKADNEGEKRFFFVSPFF